ncbi:DNA/RNA helicase, superfamily II [Actinobacteria bacterium IMCC26256]|nr:DNA/RNA helicase, superfamily II [Actinobacteria bacterium IMCC26256]
MVEDELALAIRRLLTGHPGMSAREIARELGLDKSSVNSYLYRNIGPYLRVGELPPRWSVTQTDGGAPASPPQPPLAAGVFGDTPDLGAVIRRTLSNRPGLSARDIATDIGSKKKRVKEYVVVRPREFYSIGASPRLWFLTSVSETVGSQAPEVPPRLPSRTSQSSPPPVAAAPVPQNILSSREPVVIAQQLQGIGSSDIGAAVYKALAGKPGMSAREIARETIFDKRAINSYLYRNIGRFIKVGELPPRWSIGPDDGGLTGSPLPPVRPAAPLEPQAVRPVQPVQAFQSVQPVVKPAIAPRPQATPHDGKYAMKLYAWQAEAMAAWEANGRQGIVEAVTAAGKTRLGLVAIAQVLKEGGRAVVLVPTIELLHQWKKELANIGISEIGLLGDGNNDSLFGYRVLVAVVNSTRDKALGLQHGIAGLLVADEVHRFASEHNRRGLKEGFAQRLGLSATLERPDELHEEVLLPYFRDVVYQLGYERATQDGVIARVRVAMVGVDLLPEERERYDELDSQVRLQHGVLINKHGAPSTGRYAKFMSFVVRLSKKGSFLERIAANKYLKAVGERRKILAETPNKLDALESLASAIAQSDRAIMFTSTIDSCEAIVQELASLGFRSASHHSKIKKKERFKRLKDFATGLLKAIVTAHTLEEGIDVPTADLGIIFGGSKQRREMVQRLGRVLRLKPDGRDARFVVLYVEGTSEDPKRGYQEEFIEEMVGIAREVKYFNSGDSLEAITKFLAP